MIALSSRLTTIVAAARIARSGAELTPTEQRELAELAGHLELASAWGRESARHLALVDSMLRAEMTVRAELVHERDAWISQEATARAERDDLRAEIERLRAAARESGSLRAERDAAVRAHAKAAEAEIERLTAEVAPLRERCHAAAHASIDATGSVGPESVDDAPCRAVAEIERLRALVRELTAVPAGDVCKRCAGAGEIDADVDCPACDGSGWASDDGEAPAPKVEPVCPEPARVPVAVGQVRRKASAEYEILRLETRHLACVAPRRHGITWTAHAWETLSSDVADWPLVTGAPEVDEPARGDEAGT